MNLKLVIILTLLSVPFLKNADAGIPVPTLRAAIGYSAISFSAGAGGTGTALFPEGTSLGSMLTLNPMFLWDAPSVRSRLGFNLTTDIGSEYGFLSTTGIGFTIIFYPMGLSSVREVKSDFSEVIKTRISPYLHFSLTPMRFSATKSDFTTPDSSSATTKQYFDALMVETNIGIGVDYPMGEDLVVFGGLHYRFSAYTEQADTIGAITFTGPALLVGVMTNFY